MNKLKQLFKLGTKQKTVSENIISVNFNGKTQKVTLFKPYGLFINPENNTIVGLLADQGNEESLIGLVTDIENTESLALGEMAIGIPSKKTRIFFSNENEITFKIEDTTGGDFAARFNELKSGFDQLKTDHNNFLLHVHGSSGTPPIPPASPSTASIDNAKIDKIKFPS